MKDKKKQTAVDWLRNEFHKVPQSQFGNLFKQAKEMEKQQIIDACNHGVEYEKSPYENAEHYYNETYKK